MVPQRERPDRLTRLDANPAAYRARARRYETSDAGALSQRLTAVAIAIVFAAFLFALGVVRATEAGTAERIIARGLPALTQVGELLGIHGADLKAAAATPNTKVLKLPGYPIDATLTPGEVDRGSTASLQLLLDARGARALYERGVTAFSSAGSRGTLATGPFLSGPWVLHGALSLLTKHTHGRMTVVAVSLAALGLALAVLFCLQVSGYGRLVGIGIAGLCGGLVAGLGTLFIWLVVQLFYSGAGSPLALAGWGMMADVLWTLVLVDAVGLACSCALIVAGLLLAAIDRDPETARPAPVDLVGQPVPRRRRPLD